MMSTLRRHAPEYLAEAAGLAAFMIVAAVCVALVEHPESRLHSLVPNPVARRFLVGLAMGLTAIGLIYSPWGQRSGAHLNPATTLAFLFLGRIHRTDAMFYILAQCVGGIGGILVARLLLGPTIAHPAIHYVVTLPGPAGPTVAFVAEFLLAAILMSVVLHLSHRPALARLTGVAAGLLVCLFITFEAPLSGMSLNPARSLASAAPSATWTSFWIYLTAPVLGMLLAARAFLRSRRSAAPVCPKLHHGSRQRCIFCGQPAARV